MNNEAVTSESTVSTGSTSAESGALQQLPGRTQAALPAAKTPLLNPQTNKPIVFYHGTSKSAGDKIRTEGFKGGQISLTSSQNQAKNYAMQNFGWDAMKANNAIQWLQNPNNVSFDTLFKVYEMVHAPSKQQVQSQQRVADYQQREQRLKVPQSTAVTSGTSQAPLNDEQIFNKGMLDWKK